MLMMNMMQMGFGLPTNMEDMEAMVYGNDDDDDLEAELAALTGEVSTKKLSPVKKGKFILLLRLLTLLLVILLLLLTLLVVLLLLLLH